MHDTAHEIRNLLTVIAGYCSRGLEEKLPVKSCFEKILAASGKIEDVIKKQLRRVDHLTYSPLDLNAIVLALVDAFSALPGADVKVVLQLEEDLPPGPMGDAGAMFRALLNLCLNARKAMPTGGCLKIATRRRGPSSPGEPERIAVLISDTGCGMSPDQAKKVWSGELSGDGEHGRGLLIAKKTVDQMGGQIEFMTQEGKGTTFQVSLPLPLALGTLAA